MQGERSSIPMDRNERKHLRPMGQAGALTGAPPAFSQPHPAAQAHSRLAC